MSKVDDVSTEMQRQDTDLRYEVDVSIRTGKQNMQASNQAIEQKLNAIETLVQGMQQIDLTPMQEIVTALANQDVEPTWGQYK